MSQENKGDKTYTAGEALEAYRRVKLDSADAEKVVYADADDVGFGVCTKKVASGEDVTVRRYEDGGSMLMVCAAQVEALDVVYAADDGKINDVTTVGRSIGIALEAGSADLAEIEVLPLMDMNSILHHILANSAAVTNTTAETTFSNGSKTIVGTMLRVGDKIKVRLAGKATATNGTDTLNVKLYVGTGEIIATGALDVADNDIFYIDAEITIEATGASGAVRAAGVTTIGAQGTATAKPFLKATAAQDLSGNVAIAAKATWSVANAGNSCRLEVMSVELQRQ